MRWVFFLSFKRMWQRLWIFYLGTQISESPFLWNYDFTSVLTHFVWEKSDVWGKQPNVWGKRWHQGKTMVFSPDITVFSDVRLFYYGTTQKKKNWCLFELLRKYWENWKKKFIFEWLNHIFRSISTHCRGVKPIKNQNPSYICNWILTLPIKKISQINSKQ